MNKYRIYLIISVFILTIIGIIMITSSSYVWSVYKFTDGLKYMKNQLLFSIIGFIVIYFINRFDSNFFYKNVKLFLFIGILLLILVIIPFIGVVRNGSRSWFGFASFGIQPSEAMKTIMVLFASKVLSNKKEKKSFKDVIIIFIILFFVFFLIMLQPDFGTGFIIILTILAMLFIANLNVKFFYISSIIGVVGVIFLIIIAPYRIDRITSFLNPWSDPLGKGFQIIQSLYAIGPGGLLGVGLFKSRQKFFYLPEPQTDFIFSIICEELGIIGALLIITLFFIILYSSIKIAINTTDLFKKYTIFGLSFGLIIQVILNLSVVTGLIPVTGVTLPFISYGGSSLLISMVNIGIILNLSKMENRNVFK